MNLQGLVDMLDDKRHQPAVLQSLGCIAQIAMPVFETRETEVVEFIRDKILKSESVCITDVLFSVKPHYLFPVFFSFSYWKTFKPLCR